MTKFTDDQMLAAIAQKGIVKDSYVKIQEACQALQEGTGCPDEDIDDLLRFLVGRWQ
ncbi:hypothetical protein [Prochlorococcus marinus]|uniref:Uncharacterized protein n=1 Tax=Prochlorococcus marinus (strain MIT 9211) TaxID=93059 RepID=A9B9Q6_PROM4|nr:hypothetical protein [Prochlorococcus marinus]ABX08568.1 Hypothetical protein P9211_06371 [Prochlorococcus marinus str. MIT 9211]